MSDTASEPAARIASLDMLRGIAILGILFMNIDWMGASVQAALADPAHIGWTPLDRIAWTLRQILAEGTARAMLEMLFGAGMVILTDRFADTPAVARRYYVRNLVLTAFGMIHVFVLLWPGDILHTYGIAALVAFLFRRLEPRWLLYFGLSLAMLTAVNGAGEYASAAMAEANVAAVDKQAAGSERAILAEDRARTGDARSWTTQQWANFVVVQNLPYRLLGVRIWPFELAVIWEAAATMLVGAALFRWGILQGTRSRRLYLGLTLACYGFGLPARAIGMVEVDGGDGMPKTIWATYELARLATAVGHVGLIHLILGTAAGARALGPFAAAGRTALTIYILQSLVCLWVLYPPFGLALYGTQGWAALMATAVAVNLVLLVWANWWVRDYRLAPVEWAWRSLVERRWLAMRRAPPAHD